jgi:hypothetical protein
LPCTSLRSVCQIICCECGAWLTMPSVHCCLAGNHCSLMHALTDPMYCLFATLFSHGLAWPLFWPSTATGLFHSGQTALVAVSENMSLCTTLCCPSASSQLLCHFCRRSDEQTGLMGTLWSPAVVLQCIYKSPHCWLSTRTIHPSLWEVDRAGGPEPWRAWKGAARGSCQNTGPGKYLSRYFTH